MRIVLFGAQRRVGAWVSSTGTDGLVVDLNHAYTALLRDQRGTAGARAAEWEVPADLASFIRTGPAGIDAARAAVDHALEQSLTDQDVVHDRTQVRLHPPTVRRPRIACAAGNFAAHTRGSQASRATAARADPSDALAGLAEEKAVPSEAEIVAKTRARGVPRGFWKDFSFEVGPDDEIEHPAGAELFDYEGEAAVVLGRRAHQVAAQDAGAHVWGITLLNDLSIRGVSGRGSLNFVPGKNFDGAASVGPAILVGEFDPNDIDIEVHVNGELRQRYNTGEMIFSHAQYLAYLSRTTTLWPGDMISGGSGAGSAIDSSVMKPDGKTWPNDLSTDRFLSPGDVVTVSSPGIGSLSNRIVPAKVHTSS